MLSPSLYTAGSRSNSISNVSTLLLEVDIFRWWRTHGSCPTRCKTRCFVQNPRADSSNTTVSILSTDVYHTLRDTVPLQNVLLYVTWCFTLLIVSQHCGMIHHITGKSVTKLNQKEADVDHENKVGEAAESYVMVQYGNLWHIILQWAPNKPLNAWVNKTFYASLFNLQETKTCICVKLWEIFVTMKILVLIRFYRILVLLKSQFILEKKTAASYKLQN